MSAALLGGLAVGGAIFALGLLPFAARVRAPALAHPDRPVLRDAGWTLTLVQWEALRAGAIVAGAALGSLVGFAAVAAVACGALQSLVARSRAAAARERARRAIAPLLFTTQASLRSGLALPEALRRAVSGCEDAITRRPFDEALARFDLGDPLDLALGAGALRADGPRLRDAMQTLALGVSERMPAGRAASLIGAVAELAQHDDALEAEVQARSAGVRMQMYLLAAVVPILALYLVITMPGLAATLASPIGRTVLLPGAGLLEIAGIVVSRRIVRSVWD
jgi:Flp pilus assembly protein TadB